MWGYTGVQREGMKHAILSAVQWNSLYFNGETHFQNCCQEDLYILCFIGKVDQISQAVLLKNKLTLTGANAIMYFLKVQPTY